MKSKYYLAMAFTALVFTSYTQEEFKCGTHEKLLKLYEEDPQLRKDHEELLKNALSVEKNGTLKNVVFTIPVVFHILHDYGNENISEAQIRDQMEILNEDFRAMNNDISSVIPEYQNIYGDARIEFKLATLDPSGNCTDGIDRIYTHETYIGDDYSKLNQWPRFNYLNIWVVANMENGVAGYAYYPTAVDGLGFFRDGIMIRHNYIGSIGTGNPQRSRALTHEIGHYLGLPHTWGSTNEPGVACGNDGIPDTPVTRGFSTCPSPQNAMICSPNVVENYQNFMDYSYCSVMFTQNQADAMRNILQAVSGQRNMLIREEVPEITGINITGEPQCKPIADFHANKQYICMGDPVTLFNDSYNGDVTSWEWTITDGSNTILSNEESPTVIFAQKGYKNVRLKVSNQFGEDILVRDNYVYVNDQGPTLYGPESFNLNNWSGNASEFAVFNHTDNHSRFQYINQNGIDNSPCFKLNTYFSNEGAFPLSVEGMYYNRLGGTKDELITPAFDLRNTQNVSISFDYAYATNSISLANLTDRLVVYSSRNCGETWIPRRTITGAELNTIGYGNYEDIAPANNGQWKTVNIPYTPTSQDGNTIFKIEFTASDYAGNLYIDNINIDGVLDLNEISSPLKLEVYPNPVNSSESLTVKYSATDGPVRVTLKDLQGKVVSSNVYTESGDNLEVQLDTHNLSPGYYFLQLNGNHATASKKIIKL